MVAIALETITAEYLLVEVNDAKENGMFYNVFNEKSNEDIDIVQYYYRFKSSS